jgi:hypothetical protein
MYCPQCGGTNEDSARFCGQCGLDIEEYKKKWQQPAGEGTQQTQATGGQSQPYTQPTYGQQPYGAQPSAQPYQPAYQQPSAPAQYGQPYGGYAPVPNIPSYMAWAIVTLILCFWPTGIAAVVYASQVSSKLAIGDYAGAQESSRKAKKWSWISFWVAVASWILVIIIWIVVVVAIGASVEYYYEYGY